MADQQLSLADLFLQEDEMLKQLQFFSVASDGRVTLWTLAKSELLHQVRYKEAP